MNKLFKLQAQSEQLLEASDHEHFIPRKARTFRPHQTTKNQSNGFAAA